MEKNNIKKEIISFIRDIIIIMVVAFLLTRFVVIRGSVQGKSMLPTLETNQQLVLDKISIRFNNIKRFDIVGVHFPGEENHWIKRVVGMPGEYVEFKDNGKLYIDGVLYEEPYLDISAVTKDFTTTQILPETGGIIPEGEYLVLGDNRNNSKDGRMMGTARKEDIVGIARFSLYPFDRFGFLD